MKWLDLPSCTFITVISLGASKYSIYDISLVMPRRSVFPNAIEEERRVSPSAIPSGSDLANKTKVCTHSASHIKEQFVFVLQDKTSLSSDRYIQINDID